MNNLRIIGTYLAMTSIFIGKMLTLIIDMTFVHLVKIVAVIN